jgi:hypothetical protein
MKRRSSEPRNARAISAIWVVIALPVVIMMAWIAIEIGSVLRSANQAKLAADAIALAAATRYSDGTEAAVQEAFAAAGACRAPNGPVQIVVAEGPGGGGDLYFGTWDESSLSFAPDLAEGGPAAEVTVRFAPGHPNGTVHLLISGLFDSGGVTLERTSVAVYNPPKHLTSLLLPDPALAFVSMGGTAALRAKGGVSVASQGSSSVQLTEGASMNVAILRSAGTMDGSLGSRISGSVESSATVPEDPYIGVTMPAFDTNEATGIAHTGAGTLHVMPGIHEALSFSSGTIVLDPGMHQFIGGIELSGDAVLQLDEALVQLQDGSGLQLRDDASITGTSLGGAGDWVGFWFIQGGAGSAWSVTDNASIIVDGRCYAPGVAATLGDFASVRMEEAVFRSLTMFGASRLRLSSDIEAIRLPVVPGRARLVR